MYEVWRNRKCLCALINSYTGTRNIKATCWMIVCQRLQFSFNIPSNIDIKQWTRLHWHIHTSRRSVVSVNGTLKDQIIYHNLARRLIFCTIHQHTSMLVFPSYFYWILSLVKCSKVRLNEANYVPRQPACRRRPVI